MEAGPHARSAGGSGRRIRSKAEMTGFSPDTGACRSHLGMKRPADRNAEPGELSKLFTTLFETTFQNQNLQAAIGVDRNIGASVPLLDPDVFTFITVEWDDGHAWAIAVGDGFHLIESDFDMVAVFEVELTELYENHAAVISSWRMT